MPNISVTNLYKDQNKRNGDLPIGVTLTGQNQSLTQLCNAIAPISQSGGNPDTSSFVTRCNNGNLSGEVLYGGSPTLTNVSLSGIGSNYAPTNGTLPVCAWKYVPTGYAANNSTEGAQPFDCIDYLVQGNNFYGVRQIVHGQTTGELSPDSASMGIALKNSGSVIANQGDFAGAMYFQSTQQSYLMTDTSDVNGKSIDNNTSFRMPKSTTNNELAFHCFWIKAPEASPANDVVIYTTNGNNGHPSNRAFVNGGFVFYIDESGYGHVQRFDGTNGTGTCFDMRSPNTITADKWTFFAFQVSSNANTVSTSTNYVFMYSFQGRGFTHTAGGTQVGAGGRPQTGYVSYGEGNRLIYNPGFTSGWQNTSNLMNGFQLGHHYIFAVDSSNGGAQLEQADINNMVGVLDSGSQYTS